LSKLVLLLVEEDELNDPIVREGKIGIHPLAYTDDPESTERFATKALKHMEEDLPRYTGGALRHATRAIARLREHLSGTPTRWPVETPDKEEVVH
jgi:hypothetical protein